jgi:hypothetical protein
VIAILQTSTVSRLHIFEVRYDDECDNKPNCSVDLHIDSDLDGRLIFYYRLTHFHQNHRRYVTSRAADQLHGDYVADGGLDACDPLRRNASGAILVPCGLAARSFFNDTFDVTHESHSFPLSDSGIAWDADRRLLFGRPSELYAAEGADLWLDSAGVAGGQTNEHFIVWMRLAALPDLEKVYLKCDSCQVAAGTYTVLITNNYPVDSFKGEKWVGIREERAFGARNKFFEVLCWVLGAVWSAVALALVALHCLKPRRPGDRAFIMTLIAEAEAKAIAARRQDSREVGIDSGP